MRILGLTLITFITLMAYCVLEHLAKENISPKATTHQLIKEFAPTVYYEDETLDSTYSSNMGNTHNRHIDLIHKLGLSVGSYSSLAE